MTTLDLERAASLWYPIMLAQQADEITEGMACELLAMGRSEYREKKGQAIYAVKTFIHSLPSPSISLLDVMRDRPDLLTPKD